ncbi:MAG TPA: HAD family hydrolase [Candidatus Dormibacteraeota bacterium]|nr:HAD family hydrolase [Candidatus Dormibacteraeota bacterium]
MGRSRQHLVIDGDDTLWENNIFFEAAAEAFIDFLNHSTLSREQVRNVLDEVERANLAHHGYGSAAFGRNLQETFRRLAEREVASHEMEHLATLGRQVVSQPVQLLPGVEETLAGLARRHDLTLFTKGKPEEQTMKVDRSGLAGYFGRVVVTPEKDVAAYHGLVAAHAFEPDATWMVGNSPRSDVNPPLEAGLRAVYIPHPRTWSLEVVDIVESDQLLVLERFPDLAEHF